MMSATRVAALEGHVLALWLGASALFTIVVARAAFAVLPTRTLAGALVGRVLPVLFLTGIVVGLLLVALEWPVLRERWARAAAGAAMAVACAIAQFHVAPQIERLRDAIGGPLEALAAGDPQRAAFGRLHAVSVAWLGIAILAALVGLISTWRALDSRPASVRPTPTLPTNG